MTESMLSNRVLGTLTQIKEAIKQLQEWNKNFGHLIELIIIMIKELILIHNFRG